jgi:hypothetical protein
MARSAARRSTEERMDHIEFQDKPEGPIAAAIIAGGIGATALGFFTTLAEASEGVKDWLQWSDAVGPLSGKVLMAVLVWLVAWVVLHLALSADSRAADSTPVWDVGGVVSRTRSGGCVRPTTGR